MQVFHRHLHHAGVGGGGDKQGKAGSARQEHHPCKAQGGDEGDEGGLAHAGTDAVEAPRPQVLAGVGGNGVAEGHRRGLQQAVELVGGGKARDVEIAQAVEHLLHRHAAHGDHGILEGHGRGQFQQLPCVAPVEGKFSLLEAQRFQLQHGHQADHRGHALSDNGGGGGSDYAPVEHHHKQQIQGDVRHGGGHHGDQRRTGITQRPQQGGKQVIGGGNADAAIENMQISGGQVEHPFQRAHQPQ